MKETQADLIKIIIWEEIALDLAKEAAVEACLCCGNEFYNWLKERSQLPFEIESAKSDILMAEKSENYDLIIGWQVLTGEDSVSLLKKMHKMLREGGEVRLFGFYSQPVRHDLLLWEKRCRERDKRAGINLPLPGAVTLAQISALIKDSPFQHYSIRKKGIYYQSLLTKQVLSE